MDEESDYGILLKGVVFLLAFIAWGTISDFLITIFAESAKLEITTIFSQLSSSMSGGGLEQTGKNVVSTTVVAIDLIVAVVGAAGTVALLETLVNGVLGFLDILSGIFGGGD